MLFRQRNITHEHQTTFRCELLIINSSLATLQIRLQSCLYLSRFLKYNCLNLIEHRKVMVFDDTILLLCFIKKELCTSNLTTTYQPSVLRQVAKHV